MNTALAITWECFQWGCLPHLIVGTPAGVLASNRSVGAFEGMNAPLDMQAHFNFLRLNTYLLVTRNKNSWPGIWVYSYPDVQHIVPMISNHVGYNGLSGKDFLTHTCCLFCLQLPIDIGLSPNPGKINKNCGHFKPMIVFVCNNDC